MASKPSTTSNGTANPVFRRQASTAGVNPVLTVALQPVPKVDYSVTKGGARTWIVLLVFVILCSSLYTIFSAKELGESKHDLNAHRSDDYDDTPDYNSHVTVDDNDDDDDDDDDNYEPPVKKQTHSTQQKQKIVAPPPIVDADDDDEDEEEVKDHSLGGRLFAGLRKKITDRLMDTATEQKKSRKVKVQQEKEKPKTLKKLKRSRIVEEDETNDDDEANDDNANDDDDDVEDEIPEPPKRQRQNRRAERKEKYRKYESVKEEEPEADVDDDDNDDDDNNDDDKDEIDQNNKEDDDDDDDNISKTKNDKGDDDNDDDDDDDDDEDDDSNKTVGKTDQGKNDNDEDENDEDDEEDSKKTISPREARRARRQQQRTSKNEVKSRLGGNRECNHIDCPDNSSAKPRKSLLLKKKRNQRIVIDQSVDNDDDDEDEDDDDDDKNDNDEPDNIDDDDDDEPKLSDRESSSSYKRHAITTKEEIGFRNILDKADLLVEKHEYEEAMELFDHVIAIYPSSSRAFFGKARAYDIRGEIEANESDRTRAIEIYQKILQNPATPEALFRQAAQRLIEKTRFKGLLHQTLVAHRLFIDRFPEELPLQTDFAITFVMMKRYEDARTVLSNVIASDPNNVMALAYYGYILKAHDDKVEQGVALMRKSLKLAVDEIKDPKFYYQLGHGLTSLGKKNEAQAVYQKAAQMGVFMTAQQRSLYNIDGLTARPWWNLEQTQYTKFLKTVERQWATIRQEGMEVLRDCSDCWLDHNQQLVIDGQWKYFPIMSEQKFIKGSCARMPQTCLILQEFASSSNASKSEMYLSVLSSGGQILPHCGPTNYHLQAHLGLVAPSEARLRVANETRGWRSGKFVVFDESFEHEMQFEGASSSSFRLVLVLQLWHPEVQPHQRILSFLT